MRRDRLIPPEDQGVLVFDFPEELFALGDIEGFRDWSRKRHVERFVRGTLNLLNPDSITQGNLRDRETFYVDRQRKVLRENLFAQGEFRL